MNLAASYVNNKQIIINNKDNTDDRQNDARTVSRHVTLHAVK